jgi:methyltransferase (TIGR00027 family)
MKQKYISRRGFLEVVVTGGLSATMTNALTACAPFGSPNATALRPLGTAMDQGRPSTTAQSAAMYRAAHQLLDDPRVFNDPLALGIIGTESAAVLRSDPKRFKTNRALRAFIALRSRYTEDELALAVHRGVRQYVILGAGLDTSSFRKPHAEFPLRVFEVDHPATQAWKHARLGEAGIMIPDSLTFAPVDFERQSLGDGLRRAGFNFDEAAYFSLLGVVVYLTKPAILETFKFVAALPAGSEIVFDFGIPSAGLTEPQLSARESAARRAASIGEPWITYFDPATLASELKELGFSHVEELSPEDANRRYFKERADGLRVGSSGRLMKARV